MDNIYGLRKTICEEATILESQDAMDRGDITSRELVMHYLLAGTAFSESKLIQIAFAYEQKKAQNNARSQE